MIDAIASGDALNPPVWQRAVWAVSAGVMAAVLLAGGLEALQTAVIASALPFAFVMIFIGYGLLRALQMEGRVRQPICRRLTAAAAARSAGRSGLPVARAPEPRKP